MIGMNSQLLSLPAIVPTSSDGVFQLLTILSDPAKHKAVLDELVAIRDAVIAEQKTLAEFKAATDASAKEITDREASIAGKESDLADRVAAHQAREAALGERESLVVSREAAAAKSEAALVEYENRLADQARKAEQLRQLLVNPPQNDGTALRQ